MTIKPKPILSITNTDIIHQATWLADGTQMTPERLIERIVQDKLRRLYESEMFRVKVSYITCQISAKEYIQATGERPTDIMIEKAKENMIRQAKARFISGQINAKAYKKETGQAPSEKLKERSKRARQLNANIETFAKQGAHCYPKEEVEKLFQDIVLKRPVKDQEPLTKEFDL